MNKDAENIKELYVESLKKLKTKADLNGDGKISKYEKKRADAILKNNKDKNDDDHICALEVEHRLFGKGECVFAEHAEPDSEGYVSWYTVQFEHGREVVNTKDVDVLKESSHGSHKKK